MGKGQTRAGVLGSITSDDILKGSTTTGKAAATVSGFGVFAYYTNTAAYGNAYNSGSQSPNFMYNQQVAWSSSTWAYSPIKYWPNDTQTSAVDQKSATGTQDNGGKISFFAYAPYTNSVTVSATTYELVPAEGTFKNGSNEYVATATTDARGILSMTSNAFTYDPQITYRLPTLPTEVNSVDLLWGTAGQASYQEADGTPTVTTLGTGYNKDLQKQKTGEKVNFLFKHALAKFGGSASANTKGGVYVALDIDNIRTGDAVTNGPGTDPNSAWDSKTLVTITGITIENGVAVAGDGALYDQGTFDLATGVWNGWTNIYTFSDAVTTVDDGTPIANSINKAVGEPSTKPVYDGTTDNRWEYSGGDAFEGVTTTLKQIYNNKDGFYIIPTNAAQSLKVTVSYIVRTYDAKLATPSGESSPCSKIEQTISKVITVPTPGFLSNSQYRLNIFLGLTSVKFTASVAAWSDPDGATEDETVTYVDLPINVE